MPRHLAFHKPYGVVSQFSDREETGRPTLKNYIDVPDVYPVGRLDQDSEGLLLLTDDGALQHRLSDPRFGKEKTYWVQVEGLPDAEALRRLSAGVVIQDYRTKRASVRRLEEEPAVGPRDPPVRFRKSIPTSWIELKIVEGRNRQVRRMTAAVGYPTLRIVRVGIGGVQLGDLHAGQWREVTREELLLCGYSEKIGRRR
jgi:23S rRNA pseudouridine2457 synthase